jgi:hypothetical protein
MRESSVHRLDPDPEPLGPGLHAAWIELATDTVFRVRTASGRKLDAKLANEVEREWINQCFSQNQMVIVSDSPLGPLILGALQTRRQLAREADGTLAFEANRIELRAEQEIVIRTGNEAAVKLQRTGKVRINGHRLLIDASANVRVLSALVELP